MASSEPITGALTLIVCRNALGTGLYFDLNLTPFWTLVWEEGLSLALGPAYP